MDDEGKAHVEILTKLRRHSAAVNVCRFSPYGKLLATAGDGRSLKKSSVGVFFCTDILTAVTEGVWLKIGEKNVLIT